MKRLKFLIAVAITSLVLVAAVGAFAVLTLPIGALAAQGVMASAPWAGHAGFGPPGFGGPGFKLPPELRGLIDLPPAERFAHFAGVQVRLKDKDNRPLTVSIVPGTATAIDAKSLTIAANDGSTKTFTLNDDTIVPRKPTRGSPQATQPNLANGDQVVVVRLNDDAIARAVINCGKDGFGPGGFGGPPPWVRFGWSHR